MITRSTLLCAAMTLALVGAAHAAITLTPLGEAAPPTTFEAPGFGLQPLIPAIDDTSPLFADVTSAPLAPGKDVLFSVPLSHRQIGSGWFSWSHDYTGDVYYTNGASEISLSFDQEDLQAFYFHVEPNFFGVHDMTITAWSFERLSQSLTVGIEGAAGAQGFLAVTGPDDNVAGFSITMLDGTDFGIAEFGWAKTVPSPGALPLLGLAGLISRRRRG